MSFDPAKSESNARTRGLPFSRVGESFDWSTALVAEDRRKDYGERRFQAIGYLEGRLHVVVFVPVADGLRVISLRRANKREVIRYGNKAFESETGR